jgi:hypothetical protein
VTVNPFKVYSPEDMTALQVTNLFVPVAEKLEIDGPDHVFIHGHRGCGKSMMLRSMAPDCQIIDRKADLKDLPYLGVYATIKATGLDVAEYERLKDQHVGLILAEHSLVTFLGSKIFESLREHCTAAIDRDNGLEELRSFILEKVLRRISSAGAELTAELQRAKEAPSVDAALRAVSDTLDSVSGTCFEYLRRSAFSASYQPYQGPLLAYRDFLFPVLCELNTLSFMPTGRPVYCLVDDADNLNAMQTRVLNTWVSFRTGHQVSFKISTQLSYKTYVTSSRQRIEAPHDFRELHVSSIHTGPSSSSGYPQWVNKVVQKRLAQDGAEIAVDVFFPEDEKQESAIKAIANELKRSWESAPRGSRPNDDAYRYARPDYIKSLGGVAKQQSTYRYAGFQQLVHISSGIIRFFLDNAARMYAQQELRDQKRLGTGDAGTVSSIDPLVQDEVVRQAADNLMFGDFDRLEQDAKVNSQEAEVSQLRQLRNLIRGLGGMFYEILVSERSERRVFSIALSEDLPDATMDVLRLGVRLGYLYEAAIGAKEGRWRTRRYIMTRRLAPHFKLDPTGFSGYLFVTADLLALAIENPKQAIAAFRDDRLGAVVDSKQLPLEF